MTQKTATAAIISLAGAVLGFVALFAGHPFWAMLIAILSIISGSLGVMMSASPKIRGGLLSILGILMGLVLLVASILGAAGAILF